MRIHRLAAAAVLAAVMLAHGAAAAEERYDRRLDEAAARIIAARMGPLREGFAPDERPALSVAPARSGRQRTASPAPGQWHDGLAIAVERRPTASPEL